MLYRECMVRASGERVYWQECDAAYLARWLDYHMLAEGQPQQEYARQHAKALTMLRGYGTWAAIDPPMAPQLYAADVEEAQE